MNIQSAVSLDHGRGAIPSRLWHLAGRRKFRVLLCFGNSLGNAIGDTAMATQHISFLRAINPNARITVWTSNSSLWKLLGDADVRCSPIVPSITRRDFDLCIFDWVSAGEDLLAHLRAARIFSIVWPSWGANPLVFTGSGDFERFELPVGTNQPGRIRQLYRALKVPRPAQPANRPANSAANVVLQPFASIQWKSLPPEAVLSLARDISEGLGGYAKIVMPLPPRHSSEQLLQFSDTLKRRIEGDADLHISFADSLSLSEYICLLREAALVIGPDSSSQHIAARCGVPSIALYPARSGFNYFFFGPQEGKNLQLRLAGVEGEKSVSVAVAFLADRLLRRKQGRLSSSVRRSIMKASQAFDAQLSALKRSRSLEPQVLHDLEHVLLRSLPTELEGLVVFLIEEITTVWKEAERLLQSPAGPKQFQIVRQRVRSLNSSRIISALSA